MGIRIQATFFFALALFCANLASAQVVPAEEEKPEGLMETRIDQALQNAPLRAGVFYIRPNFNMFGQYDSNGLSLPDSDDPEGDFNLQAVPGVLAVLPFRSRALLELYEEVNFIYYRELEDLRGVFDITSVRFTTGGRRVLFTIGDEFHTERVRPTLEFDFPTDQRRNRFDTALSIAFGPRTELKFGFISTTSKILDDVVNVNGIPLSQFFDRRESLGYVEVTKHISERTSLVGDFYYEDLNFAEDSLQPDANVYAARTGFRFQPHENISGDALIGYKRILPDIEEDADYSGLIGLGSLQIRVGERTTLGIAYSRDAKPSVTDNNWFFIENRVAPSIEYFITRPLSVFGQVSFGKNTYSRPGTIVGENGQLVQGEIKDDSIEGTLAVRYRIGEHWQFFVSGTTFSRDSNLSNSQKDRYLISGGVSTSF